MSEPTTEQAQQKELKPYIRPWSPMWWTERPAYKRFMVREATSVFVLLYLCLFLAVLAKLRPDNEAGFAACMEALKNPFWYLFHILCLAGAVYHSVTWFNLTPKAMPKKATKFGENDIPPHILAIVMGFGPWATITLIVFLWGLCL